MQGRPARDRKAGRTHLRRLPSALPDQGRHPDHADRGGADAEVGLALALRASAAFPFWSALQDAPTASPPRRCAMIARHFHSRAAASRDFSRLSAGPYQLYLRADLTPHAGALVDALRELSATKRTGAGNSGSGFRLALAGGPELFVRRCHRGGAMRLLFDDLYFGFHPRPLRELMVAAEAAQRGVPLAEPMGAAVRWVAPGLYRGFFVTRAAAGMTLWEFLRTDDDPSVRTYVLERAREAIETMLQRGMYHPDLNLDQ